MARPRIYKTEAIVLRQTPLGEADRILTLFTPDMGKVRAVAKGIRRTKSKLGGHLELLNQVSVSLARGRNLDIVTEAVLIESFKGFKEDLGRLSKSLYMAELVDGFSVEEASSDAVYGLLLDSLGWLAALDQPDLLLRHFEMQLLEHSGYRPELHSCVECRADLEPGDHVFSCARGGAICPDCRGTSAEVVVPVTINAMKVLRFLQREEHYAGVEGTNVSARLLAEVERLNRTYVRFLADREMKTAEFMTLVSSVEAPGGRL